MVDERPYRVPPPDARRLGWTETRIGRATELTRERCSAGSSRELAPLVVGAGAFALTFGSLAPLTQALSAAIAAGVVVTWPLSTERIRIDARGLVWRDRLCGARLRVPLERVLLRVAGRRLLLGSRTSLHVIAHGDVGDLEELSRVIVAAVERARM